MNADVSERVELITLQNCRLWARDGRGFRFRDIAFFEFSDGKTFLRAAGKDSENIDIFQNINDLERLLKGLFVRTHRDYLVSISRIEGVAERYSDKVADLRDATDECELLLQGTEKRAPLTSTYSKSIKKLLGLNSLHHLVPEHPDDKKLRMMGIIDFAWRDLYRLDPNDLAAVEEFTKKWEIVRFGKERTLKYFRQAGVNQVDKRRLAKNIIWQNWRWIMKGIQKPFTGNIRSFWYKIKNALGGDEILDPDDVDMFYDALREMIEERRLFRYKDFGLMDVKEVFRKVGLKRPEIVLVFEKVGQYQFARELTEEIGSSFICLGGEPSILSMEYFSDGLKAAIGERGLSVFVMTDINPSGVSIRNSFVDGMKKQGIGIERVEILWELKDIPDDALPGGKMKVVRYELRGSVIVPVKPSKMSQVTKALRWFETLGDSRLKTVQEYPGKPPVVTIWGIDSDTASERLITKKFLAAAAQVPRVLP